jgi:archaellum component FlaF (FlaF/FlaG flagellin family)
MNEEYTRKDVINAKKKENDYLAKRANTVVVVVIIICITASGVLSFILFLTGLIALYIGNMIGVALAFKVALISLVAFLVVFGLSFLYKAYLREFFNIECPEEAKILLDDKIYQNIHKGIL